MVLSEEPVKLTYRELADRLGISIAAARSRVRRAKQHGRWRVIPRNHPNTPAQIELPPADLEIIERERIMQAPAGIGQTMTGDVSEAIYVTTLNTLNDVFRHISDANVRMHDLVFENLDLREKLASAEAGRLHLVQRVAELEHRVRDQQERLTAGMLEKLEHTVEISRLTATLDERRLYVERLETGIRNLQSSLSKAKRPLWKKALGIKR